MLRTCNSVLGTRGHLYSLPLRPIPDELSNLQQNWTRVASHRQLTVAALRDMFDVWMMMLQAYTALNDRGCAQLFLSSPTPG